MQHALPFELVNDEPAVLLSGDKGPNPVEVACRLADGAIAGAG